MKKFYDGLCRVEIWIAGSFLVLMVVLIFAGGVARMLGHPLNWAGDIATALFAWSCFLCADIAWRRNSLMSVELLTDRLPPKAQVFCRYANYAIIGVFLAYLAVYGVWLSWTSRARSFQGIPEISYSWVSMSLSVGGLLLLITTILKIRDDLRGRIPQSPAVIADA